MKLLLDKCVSPRTCNALAASGFDAIWAGDWASDPGDDAILEIAWREARILITLDKDFGELAVALGKPHAGIVRLVDIHPRSQLQACLEVLKRYGDDFAMGDFAMGAIATVTQDRIRLRPGQRQVPTPPS